jgi:hypothetical protein
MSMPLAIVFHFITDLAFRQTLFHREKIVTLVRGGRPDARETSQERASQPMTRKSK